MRVAAKVNSTALLACVVAVAFCAGCRPRPESKSGPDAYRDQPTPVKYGNWIPDDLNPKGDQTDWKSLNLDRGDFVRVRAVIAEPGTEVTMGLYDVYGQRIDATRKPAGAGLAGKMELRRHLDPGTYYLRFRAIHGEATTYSFRVDVGAVSDELVPEGDDDVAPPE